MFDKFGMIINIDIVIIVLIDIMMRKEITIILNNLINLVPDQTLRRHVGSASISWEIQFHSRIDSSCYLH